MTAPESDPASDLEQALHAAIATRGLLASLERAAPDGLRQRVRTALLRALAAERLTARALAQTSGVADHVRLWAIRHAGR